MDEKQIPQPCEEWAEKLATAQLDNLSIAERKALGAHLLLCPRCFAAWADYRFLQDSMRRFLTTEPLPDLPPRLFRQHSSQFHLFKSFNSLLVWFARRWHIIISLLVGLLTFVIGLSIFHRLNGDLKMILLFTLSPAVVVSIFILLALKWSDNRFRRQSQRLTSLSSTTFSGKLTERKTDALYEREDLPAMEQESLLTSYRSLLVKRHRNKKGWRDRTVLLPAVMALTAMMTALLGITLLTPPLDSNMVTTLQDNGPGSLRQILLTAIPGSTITFVPSLQGKLVLNKELDIEKNVAILGPGRQQITISNGHHSNVHIHIHKSATAFFSKFAFADSLVSRQSFIYNQGNLTLKNCWVQDNISYDDGGGIANLDGTLVITNSDILRNFASGNGGGIDNKGIMTITGSIVSSNTAFENGGGIFGLNGSVNLSDTQVSDNQVLHNEHSRGGGIALFDSLLDITGSTIKENWTRGVGGGISILGSQAFLTSSVILGNMAGRGRELAVEIDPENKKNGLMILANLVLPPDPKSSIGNPRDHIEDIIRGKITYGSSRPQIESIAFSDDTIAGNPASTLPPPEESPNYRGIIRLDTYCHQLDYSTFDHTEPFNLNCVSSSGGRKKVDALQICQTQYPRHHITMSRLADYFDPTSWQCYANARLLGPIASVGMVNDFCQYTDNLGIFNDDRSTAYDWKCLHRGGILGYYKIHMDNFPVGLSVDDMCLYAYKSQIMPNSMVMSSLTDYKTPSGWACWELPV